MAFVAVLALAAMPVAGEWLAGRYHPFGSVAALAAAEGLLCLLLPGWARGAALAWVLLCFASLYLPVRSFPAYLRWFGVYAAGGLLAAVVLNAHLMPLGLCAGLSDRAVAWLAGRDDALDLLAAFNRAGYASITQGAGLVIAPNGYGLVLNVDTVTAELAKSLRSNLALVLEQAIPTGMVFGAGILGWWAGWLCDGCTVSLGDWGLTLGHVLMASILWLTGEMCLADGQTGAGAFLTAVLSLVLMSQGWALLCRWLNRMNGMARTLVCAAAGVMLPTAVTLLGVFDLLADPRKVRSAGIEGG